MEWKRRVGHRRQFLPDRLRRARRGADHTPRRSISVARTRLAQKSWRALCQSVRFSCGSHFQRRSVRVDAIDAVCRDVAEVAVRPPPNTDTERTKAIEELAILLDQLNGVAARFVAGDPAPHLWPI